jgi:ABC-type polar amino acid transport system ATPase subunit
MGDYIIEINNVNKWYGDFHVLKDVSLKVREREVVVVIGPSWFGQIHLDSLCQPP